MEDLINKKVWFVRSANINTRQITPVETGIVTKQIPGWLLPHYRIEPLDGQPAMSVPVDRIWEYGTDKSSGEITKYINEFLKEQERSVKLMKEKLEASEYKLKVLDDIIKKFNEEINATI